jgi:signal transduction histidine kinase/sugar lactone lactonase YvrE
MLEDHRGVFWIATGAGLHRFDRATGRAQLWKSPDGVPALSMNIWSLAEDRAGHLWVGTAGEGLFEMDAARAIVRHYRHDPTDPRSISDNSICSIFEDPQGRFWIGTTNGLNLLDRSAGTLSVYTSRDGLPNNMIYGILADGKGNLWMSTNKGIARFTPGTGRFRCFDLYDGLQSNEFNQGAWHRSRSGELLFGGVDGFNSFYPDNIVENTIAPPVLITTFKVADKIVPFDRPVSDMDEVEVPWQENVFSLDFVALGYREPAKNQYAYMLEGFDKQWVHCGTRRYAAYTNLDGGSYVFRVKGSNNDGLWNEKGAAVHIRVIPPPWRTWWAYVLYVLFAVAAVVAIIQFRVRRVLAVERLRQRIAADLHDDIGSGLTRISLLSDILRQQLQSGRGDADAPSDAFTTSGRGIEGGIGRIGVISRELTESMTDVVWSIDPRNDSLEKLLQRILLFAVEMCESKEIELEYSAPAAADQRRRIGSDVARCVLLLVKESVNNLVRHSGCARASLAIGIASGALTIRVRDDGRGFDAEQLKRINGLENMRARAAKLGGTLEIRSAPGEGTTLEASIPLGRENRTIGRLLRLDAINRFLRHGT